MCTSPDTPQFQDKSIAIRDRLLGLMFASEAARKQATTGSTQYERARSWRRWESFLATMEIKQDPFLNNFVPWTRTLLFSAFAQAMREASYSGKSFTTLVEGTVRAAVDHVAQTFRSNNRPDPRNDDGGNLNWLLQQQYKGYKNLDKNTTQQKALPLIVLRHLYKRRNTVENLAIAQLCIGAICFAMRSCEYLQTNIPAEQRRTKTLQLRDLRFYKKGRIINHTDANLALADTVTITFEFQKSEERHESVTMHRSGDPVLCPVRAWASIARQVLSYPGTDETSTVNTIFLNDKLSTISSATVRTKLRSAVDEIGVDKLGFTGK